MWFPLPVHGSQFFTPADSDRFFERSHGKMGRFGKIYHIRGDSIVAVPKKKTSKTRRDKRRANWKHKAAVEAKKALSLGKSVLTGRSTGFIYPASEEDDDEE
ncbi:MAG: 50S ribosomal protein L32 [Geitlerinemataceae cyanobacterium]